MNYGFSKEVNLTYQINNELKMNLLPFFTRYIHENDIWEDTATTCL